MDFFTEYETSVLAAAYSKNTVTATYTSQTADVAFCWRLSYYVVLFYSISRDLAKKIVSIPYKELPVH